MQEFVDILSKVGFPIMVAGWFMLRSDKRQDRIIEIQVEILGILKGRGEDA